MFKQKPSLEQIPPKKGLLHTQISLFDPGILPGATAHWHYELDRRRQEILIACHPDWKHRALKYLGKTEKTPQLTGQELSNWAPQANTKKLVAKLEANPADHESRILLAVTVSHANKNLPLEVYRAILLQIAVVCRLNQIDMTCIRHLLAAQNTYLQHAHHQMSGELQRLSSYAELASYGHNPQNRKEALKKVDRIRSNMDIIQGYRSILKRSHNKPSHNPLQINFSTLAKELQNASDIKTLEEQFLVLATQMRSSLLMRHPLQRISEVLMQALPDSPLGSWIAARVYMGEIWFLALHYKSGDRRTDIVKQAHECFENAYVHWKHAIQTSKKITPELKNTLAVEYAQCSYLFHNLMIRSMGSRYPMSEIKQRLVSAKHLISEIQNSHATKLALKLETAMDIEGLL